MNVHDTMIELAACLCVELEAIDFNPCFCGVVPGEAAAYGYGGDCETGGMAWVRLITAYPSSGVGQADVSINNCGTALGFDLEVGVSRLMPVGDNDGNMPTDAEILEATSKQVEAMLAMRRAIVCCGENKSWIIGAYVPFGPEGGIIGGTWEVNMQEE